MATLPVNFSLSAEQVRGRKEFVPVRKDSQSPITDAEADAALAGLARFDHVLLAVSGGADSMALMVLAAEWRARAGESTTTISVATVDHALRVESRGEAEQVSAAAWRLGLSHAILTWDGEKPRTGLPRAAREARYRLLEEQARRLGCERIAIVTAHHRDDQAETFAMRLARGAGIDGLSAMRSERPLREGSPVMLVRPFLSFPKARLVATLADRGVAHIEDPTNLDQRYERARVRSVLPTFEAAGLSAEALATSARRLGEARDALAYAQERFVASLDLSFGNEVYGKLGRRSFEAGPAFLRQKLLVRLIGRYGGASPAPQLSEVEDLVARMQRDSTSAATLGGAMISIGPRFVRIWREAGRLDQAEISLVPGEPSVWDRRFVLRLSPNCPAGSASITVKPLGEKGYAAIMSRLVPGHRPPARAAAALPSFWAGETVVAAPSLAPFAVLGASPLDPAECELKPLATSAVF